VDNPIPVRTALSDCKPVTGENTLIEAPLNGKINLRGNPNNAAFIKGVENALGLVLPPAANTVTSSAELHIFWLGPNEWLIHLPLETVEEKSKALREALDHQHAAITEVSDYFSVLELSGPQSREIVASASPFDTRPQHFKAGECAQTRFGHASILLWPLAESLGFGLQVRWSYAQYVYDYLSQSIRNAEALNAFELNSHTSNNISLTPIP
jgi:sarcosine oxidase subunit gamma